MGSYQVPANVRGNVLQKRDDNMLILAGVRVGDGTKTKNLMPELHLPQKDHETFIQNPNDMLILGKEEAGNGTKAKNLASERHPLQIDHVLETIFSYLDAKSIKNARQINKLWSAEGAKMLINKCYVRIPSNLRDIKFLAKSKNMSKFQTFLSHKFSNVANIPHIVVEAVGDIQVWKFLGVLGSQVESLKLNITEDMGKSLSYLLNLLPGLKYLNFEGIENAADDDDICNKSQFIVNALTNAVSTAKKNEHPLTISFINLTFSTEEQMKVIEKFSTCRNITIEELNILLQLKSFDSIPDLEARVIVIINRLLFKSQKTLRKVTLLNCQVYLPSIKFCIMTALTEINLIFQPQNPSELTLCKFPPTFRFSNKFPNLQKISIDYEGAPIDAEFFVNLLKKTGNAHFVKCLEYSDLLSNCKIDPLLKTFPNIEYLKTEDTRCSKSMLRSVWRHGQNLKTLDVSLDMGQYYDVAVLDSFFTGLTPQVVDKIRNSKNLDAYTLAELKRLRNKPSILNLKQLEELRMTVYIPKPFWLTNRTLVVAAVHGFKLLPKDLKIFIHFPVPGTPYARAAVVELSELPNVTVQFQEDQESYKFDFVSIALST